MAKTLANLITNTRMYLDEVSEADWTDAQIAVEINYAYLQMYTAIIETYEDYYRKKVSSDLVEDQQEYELPSDFFKVKRIELTYQSGSEASKATPIDFSQIARQLSAASMGSSSHPYYDLSGNYLRILPIPQESVTNGISLTYIKQVDELVDEADEVDIPFPDRYAKTIVLGAVAELLRKGQQEEQFAARYDVRFEAGIEKMKQELEDRYMDGSKMILDTVGDWIDFEGPGPVDIRTF